MNARSLCVKFILAASLAITAPWLWAQDGVQGALSRANLSSPVNLGPQFGEDLTIADFDSDHQPDGAVLFEMGRIHGQTSFRIEFHFTGRENTDLSFESNETTLAISASDVNGDGADDIVVEQPFTHKRLQVWLNDGRGDFRRVRSEDFPSGDVGNHEGLDAPSQRPDCPALCLPPQRGSELAILTALGLPSLASSAAEQPRSITSAGGSLPASPYGPRAPPLSFSL